MAKSAIGIATLVGSLSLFAGCARDGHRQTFTGSTRANVRLTGDAHDDAATTPVILTGEIVDHGTATSVDDTGRVDASHRSQWRVDLTNGSFRLDLSAIAPRLADIFGSNPVDPTTCVAHVEVSAAAPVVSGSGTGQYTGITGGFDLTVTIDEVVDAAPQHCDATSPIATQSVVTTGVGHIRLESTTPIG